MTNVQRFLIWELMIYKFELSYYAAEASKNICSTTFEGTVDHIRVTRGFKMD